MLLTQAAEIDIGAMRVVLAIGTGFIVESCIQKAAAMKIRHMRRLQMIAKGSGILQTVVQLGHGIIPEKCIKNYK